MFLETDSHKIKGTFFSRCQENIPTKHPIFMGTHFYYSTAFLFEQSFFLPVCKHFMNIKKLVNT